MQRVQPVDPQHAEGHVQELLEAVRRKLGMVPNLTRALAASPAVLEAYLGLSGALGRGVLPARVQEQLALAVGEANHCDYCLAAHSAIGKRLGLTDQEVLDSRRGVSADPQTEALLRFARAVVGKRGQVDDADLAAVRKVGYGDAEIAEVVAHVALNVLTNYFNHVAGTTIDFPRAPALPA
jgi:uncharacterized peroxidase-related enzyme